MSSPFSEDRSATRGVSVGVVLPVPKSETVGE